MQGCGGGEQFYCTISCHHTEFVWTFCVATKSEIADKLVSILKLEIKSNMLISLQRDGETEFSGNVSQFLADEGVHERVTPRYDHNANGHIEAVNRRISDSARSILLDSNLPLSYWPFAVAYSTLLSNHVYTHGHADGLTPAERLGHVKIPLAKFQRFGSKAEVHIPKELQRGKFSPRSEPGIFLGLTPDGFSMIFYSIDQERIFNTRSARFLSTSLSANREAFDDWHMPEEINEFGFENASDSELEGIHWKGMD